MCGLCGIIHWDGAPVERQDVRRMIGRIVARGPDEQCAAFPAPGVSLAHARLRIIDLTPAARQPMASDDGTVWLLFNGEIYNFRALRTELEAAGRRFRSRSDTEVILRAYEQWGADAIPRLDGMFAIALWDARQRQLVLARDRIGKKPLFYWTDGRCVTFGSEIKALFPHGHVPCVVNEAALPFVLAYGYPSDGETCYERIAQVPPATVLTFRQGSVEPQARPYWQINLASTRPDMAPDAAATQLRTLLKDAVRRRLVADVPIGAFLSGGVDSSIIVALMAELLPGERVKTFSVGFEGDARYNETQYAQLIADRYRTDHTVFTVTPHAFDLVERLVWLHDQPFGDSSAIPTYLISQRTREHVTVALCGDGGDELFAGYQRFAAAVWSERLPKSLVLAADRWLRTLPAGSERSWLARWQRFTAYAAQPLPAPYLRWVTFCGGAPPWLLRGPQPATMAAHPSIQRSWQSSAGWTTLARVLHLNFQDYLPNDLMVKADRCSMAHGLELRSPLLDTAVVEFAASLPDRYKLRGLRTKWLLRRAFRDLPPRVIRRWTKMGFSIPLGAWWRTRWQAPLREHLDNDHALLYQYVHRSTVRTAMEDHLGGRADHSHRLWLLLTLELWLRQTAQQRASAPDHVLPDLIDVHATKELR